MITRSIWNTRHDDFLREICANYYTIFEKQGFIIDIAIMEDPIISDLSAEHAAGIFQLAGQYSQPQPYTHAGAGCHLCAAGLLPDSG